MKWTLIEQILTTNEEEMKHWLHEEQRTVDQARDESHLILNFTESQNGRGWKGPLWVI